MDKKNGNLLLKQALTYWSRGWSIIPIGYGKMPPRGFEWKKYQKERASEDELKKWFGSGKYKSLAVVCGSASGNLCVLDLDSQERCEWWYKEHTELAATLPTVKTQQGVHIYFRAEPFRKQNGDKVDLLSEGSYAILPPSPNKSWINPLNGELPLLNPFEWNLERFGINEPAKQQEFTEETEEPEDSEETERHRSHKGVVVSLESLSKEIKQEIQKAIENTLPKDEGQRNKQLFTFCRWLKGVPALRDLTAKELKPIVRQWHEKSYVVIKTKPFDRTWADFVHGWERVKWPKGDVMLTYAIKKAMEAQDILPEAQDYDTEEARFLLRILFELQNLAGDNPIFLASRKAGGILGISHTEAGKLIEAFEADGRLRLVEAHTTRKSARYRYMQKNNH